MTPCRSWATYVASVLLFGLVIGCVTLAIGCVWPGAQAAVTVLAFPLGMFYGAVKLPDSFL